MSSTEPKDVSVRLAGELFDTVVAPLAKDKRGSKPYFPLAGEPDATTYFVTPDVQVMTADDFVLPGGGVPEGLIDAVVAYWEQRGEREIAASLAEKLKPIAEALGEEAAEADGSVDILCYTLF